MRVTFETAALEAKDRFSYWHDVVCKKFVPATSRNNSREDFNARLSTRSLGALEISEMAAPPHFWSRKQEHIRADGHDELLLSILVSGTGRLEQCGRSVEQSPGDIVLYDTSRPFAYDLASEVLLLKIPRRLLTSRVADVDGILATPFRRDLPVSSLVFDILHKIASFDLPDESKDLIGPRLVSSVLELVAGLIDLESDNPASLTHRQMGLLDRIQRKAIANLDDQELCVQRMAKYGAVSSRTLNRLFAKAGMTPMRWLWQQRLEASYLALLEGKARNVTSAALQVGFSDLSHFSRSFKSAFGVTPEQLLRSRRQK